MDEKIPALSFAALGEIKKIETYALSCMAHAVLSSDKTSATRDLRSCAGEMFHVYVGYYVPLGFQWAWMAQIKSEITACLSSAFRPILSEVLVRIEVEDAIQQIM